MTKYTISPLRVTDRDAFFEASKEELRVLVALIEADGKIESVKALSEMARASAARTSSALIFWQEAGVITEGERTQTITEEFESRIETGKIREVAATKVAESIRRESLADMISEVGAIMKREALNSGEIKELVGLYEQYGLSEEYIVTLAAYLAEHSRLTVSKLTSKAIRLTEREIDTTKALEAYIIERESDSEAEKEFRKLFGIYGRAPSKTEKECFKKWSKDYGYFTEIVGEAYDIAVTNTTRGYVAYADKLLSRWYEAGCRTLAECKAKYDEDAAEKRAQREAKTGTKKTKKEPERYGEFDVNDAFMKAVERSYGSSDK